MLYEETITWKFIIVLVVGVLGFAVGAMIFAYANEPIDDPAVPISILAVVAIGLAVTLNFSRLSI
ncbi:MAG: hypothetical protein H5T92_08720, partial [Synergistales bacterium]|nr:hypothetical protein [Synergistales bacterium]